MFGEVEVKHVRGGLSPEANLEQSTPSNDRRDRAREDNQHLDVNVNVMEDMIADDAVWKKIQQNTFTRWTNEHLKKIHSNIQNLETDLEDGLRLIGLLQVLSGKTLPKYNKKPSFRSQKLENVSLALKFLEKDEGIRIVNIDSSNIVDCNLKLILGLIWHLILHYSISMQVWEGEDTSKQSSEKDKGPTPKQRLLNWCQNKVPELGISNFTSDWKDGKVIGALVDSVAPGLCPDWSDWSPNEALKNASEAMTLADDWLNVRQLIKPEEIINPNIDELSMMTYLSQYPNAKLKPGAPIRERTNPNRVRCYGPGLESSGNSVGARVQFTVETFAAGKGEVQVILENPNGHQEHVDVRFNNDRNLTYSCSYAPSIEGNYVVKVFYGQQGHMLQVPRSPFSVEVEAPSGDPSKVIVFGEGVKPDGVIIGKQTYFDISAEHAGKGVPDVIILDPKGDKQSVPVKIRQIDGNIWRCEYVSNLLGMHSVNVFFNKEQVLNSPFPVLVSPVCDAKKVKVSGRGLRPKGIRVGDKTASFQIHTESAEGTPQVKLIQPGGETIPIHLHKLDDLTYEGNYVPKKVGRYVATITYGGQEIPNSPFQIQVGPERTTGIKAYGPGLDGGMVNHPAKFMVETNGESGALGFQIEGPSQSVISCDDNGDLSCLVSYVPIASGDYYVHILLEEEDIENSPHHVKIGPDTTLHPELVECNGNGLECKSLPVNESVEFLVDPRRAGAAPLNVQVVDSKGNEVKTKLREKSDESGVFVCKYTPTQVGRQTILVSHGGVATKNSPYRAQIISPPNPKEVKVFGPGVEKGLYSTKPTHFIVDARNAGQGQAGVALSITDEHGSAIPFQVQDNGDETFTADYTPKSPGKYVIRVFFNEVEVPHSPFSVNVEPHVDLSKIQVQGLEPIVTIARRQEFAVVWSGIKQRPPEEQFRLMTPSGKEMKLERVHKRGSFSTAPSSTYYYTPFELGEYLLYGTDETPFAILCTPPPLPSRVRVHGDGLRKGVVSVPARFVIDTREAGHGPLGVTIIGPEEVPIHCLDNYDGTCVCSFLCKYPGNYTIKIVFDDREVPGSPFCSIIRPKESSPSPLFPLSTEIFLDSPTEFIVEGVPDKDKLKCCVLNPLGQRHETKSTQKGKLGVNVGFTPSQEGDHEIQLSYDGIKLLGSPYKVNVSRGSDPTRVKAFGKGLEQSIVDTPNVFTIETKGAGTGGLGLTIEGPTEAHMTCKDNRDGSCTVEYIPTAVGLYEIGIKFGDKDIPGSPFKVPVIHSIQNQKVKAYGDGLDSAKVREGVPQTFLIDASEAGPAEMSCEITGLKEPAVVIDKQNGVFEVKYCPPMGSAGKNLVYNLKYNGTDIVNTPVHLKVKPRIEPDQVKLSGDGISTKGVPASLPTSFLIDMSSAGVGDIQVDVLGPDGVKRKVDVKEEESGKFVASYLPDELGIYKIGVKFGEHLVRSPIDVRAHPTGSAEKCRITEGREERVEVGQEYCVTVDCKNGGPGAVTCRITSADGKNDVNVEVEENNEDKSYSVYYKVKESGDYAVDMKFGGQPINLGSYHFKADSSVSETFSEERTSYQTVRTTRTSKTTEQEIFRSPELNRISVPSTGGVLTAEVKTPTGKVDPADINDHLDGFVTVKYEPKVSGEHELLLCLNGQAIQGSPFYFYVDSINSDSLTAYGSGLTHGICGEPCHFTVSTKGSKAGGLQFSIEGNSKADIKCTDHRDGNIGVQYICTAPGEYKISVKFGEKHIRGSPFTAKITGEGQKQHEIIVGSLSELAISENTFNVNTSNAGYGGSDASVNAHGKGLEETKSGQKTEFFIDTSNAGCGHLAVTIDGPSKVAMDCTELRDGLYRVSWTPQAVGTFYVSILFNGSHISNSPFTVPCTGKELTDKGIMETSTVVLETSHKVTKQQGLTNSVLPLFKSDATKVTSNGMGLKKAYLQKQNQFTVNASEAGKNILLMGMIGPKGPCEELFIKHTGQHNYQVNYLCKEKGEYIIIIRWGNEDIPGSPFKVEA